MKADQERVRNLLTDTLALICKNGLSYQEELKVEGVIGVTLDNSDVFIVHINEAFCYDETKETTPTQNPNQLASHQNVSRKDRKRPAKPAAKRHVPPTVTSDQLVTVVTDNNSVGELTNTVSIYQTDSSSLRESNSTQQVTADPLRGSTLDVCGDMVQNAESHASAEPPVKRQQTGSENSPQLAIESVMPGCDSFQTINIAPETSSTSTASSWHRPADTFYPAEQSVKQEPITIDNDIETVDSDDDTVDMSADFSDTQVKLPSLQLQQSHTQAAASTSQTILSDMMIGISSSHLQVQSDSTSNEPGWLQEPVVDRSNNYSIVQSLAKAQLEEIVSIPLSEAADPMGPEFQLISNRMTGIPKLYDNRGFFFNRNKGCGNKVYWRCCLRKRKDHPTCYAKVTQNRDMFTRSREDHNHPPSHC